MSTYVFDLTSFNLKFRFSIWYLCSFESVVIWNAENMSRIVESLKKLNVENDAESYRQDNDRINKKVELTLSLEERVSLNQNDYILFVCGTQRQILYFFTNLFYRCIYFVFIQISYIYLYLFFFKYSVH